MLIPPLMKTTSNSASRSASRFLLVGNDSEIVTSQPRAQQRREHDPFESRIAGRVAIPAPTHPRL
jgi:hypothetical protein